ncbi:MAG: DNA-3-methyladenine glycosylase [Alphaproteobacteria bacterium]
MILSEDFFTRDAITVAHDLVGMFLCRRLSDGSIIHARICELELYMQNERGCHAFGGRKTERNSAMFLPGGHTYIYLCYGMYNMLNIVVDKENFAASVLIRALEYDGCDGPGKLTKKLDINTKQNGIKLGMQNNLWIESADTKPIILSGPRIGIDFAGQDAILPYRFAIKDSLYISKPI